MSNCQTRRLLDGVTKQYLITQPTVSAFVSDALLQPCVTMLQRQERSGRYNDPAIRPILATAAIAEIHRAFDSKFQGLPLSVNLGARGSVSPWVSSL